MIATRAPDLRVNPGIFTTPREIWPLPHRTWQPIWDAYDFSDTKIAIIDTGGIRNHEALPQPLAARSFVPGESWQDGNFHGTHCAGTALGTHGVGWCRGARWIIGKALANSGSGNSTWIRDAIYWAIDQGADVVSLSLGGGGPVWRDYELAAQRGWDNGCFMVAAAGNSRRDGRNTIGNPALGPGYLCIGAHNQSFVTSSFSSGGRELDFVCPGSDIISTSHRGGNKYVSSSGTSMATPAAAGAMGIVKHIRRREGKPRFKDPDDVRNLAAKHAKDIERPGRDDISGHGILMTEQLVMTLAGKDEEA